MKMEQSVPKRRHIKFRSGGITSKNNTSLEYFTYLIIYLWITRRTVGIVALQVRVNNALEGTGHNWLRFGHLLGGNGGFHKILTIVGVPSEFQKEPYQIQGRMYTFCTK